MLGTGCHLQGAAKPAGDRDLRGLDSASGADQLLCLQNLLGSVPSSIPKEEEQVASAAGKDRPLCLRPCPLEEAILSQVDQRLDSGGGSNSSFITGSTEAHL